MCGSHHHDEGHGCGCQESHSHHEGDRGWGGHEGGEREEGCGCGGHEGDHHGHHRHGHYGRGCSGDRPGFGLRRRFQSRTEQIEELEAYLKELEAEAQGVRGHLEDLRSTTAPEQPQAK